MVQAPAGLSLALRLNLASYRLELSRMATEFGVDLLHGLHFQVGEVFSEGAPFLLRPEEKQRVSSAGVQMERLSRTSCSLSVERGADPLQPRETGLYVLVRVPLSCVLGDMTNVAVRGRL